MAIAFADRVRETSTTTGTGTLNLDGAVTSFQGFVVGVGTGSDVRYAITDGVDWEVGEGVITDATPDTLTRVTVLDSSNSGSLVNFAAGTKDVFLTISADTIDALDGIAWVAKSGAYTAIAEDGILADTSSAAFTVTLPASPSDLDRVYFLDVTSSWEVGGTKNLTLGRNGKNIMGLAEDLELDKEGFSGGVIFLSGTNDWRLL